MPDIFEFLFCMALCALVCCSTSRAAVGEGEQARAVEQVRSFLEMVADKKGFSYDDETRYFGEQSLLSHVLLLKYDYVDNAGRWKGRETISLLGQLLKKKASLFRVDDKMEFVCLPNEQGSDACFVWVGRRSLDSEAYFRGTGECGGFLFCVMRHGTGHIDLSRSSVNGVGIPFALGFSSELKVVRTYLDKTKNKWTPIYVGEPLDF